MASLLRTDGTRQNIAPQNGTDFQLEELHALLGGYVEVVKLDDGRLLLVNDNGKIKQLAINPQATVLLWEFTDSLADVIVGDAVLCNDHEVR